MPGGRPRADTVQISFRVPTAWVKRAEAIAAALEEMGAEATTASVYRTALGRGLEALEKRHGIKTKAK